MLSLFTFTTLAANTNLFGNENSILPSPGMGKFLPSDSSGAVTAASTAAILENFLSTLLGILTITASLFFIVYFFIGAFKWVAGGGDSGKIQKARDQMIQGVMGLIIIIASYSVIGVIGALLGINILDPVQGLRNLGYAIP